MRTSSVQVLATLVFAVLWAAGLPPPGAAATGEIAGVWTWPLEPPDVTRSFDPPAQTWGSGHRGVDLAGNAGQTVFAAGSGVVVFVGMVAGRPVVSIDHASGLRTTYEPVNSPLAAGDAVAVGDAIGVLQAGHPGCASATCLHWGLRRGEVYLNPLLLVGDLRVRLLPLD